MVTDIMSGTHGQAQTKSRTMGKITTHMANGIAIPRVPPRPICIRTCNFNQLRH